MSETQANLEDLPKEFAEALHRSLKDKKRKRAKTVAVITIVGLGLSILLTLWAAHSSEQLEQSILLNLATEILGGLVIFFLIEFSWSRRTSEESKITEIQKITAYIAIKTARLNRLNMEITNYSVEELPEELKAKRRLVAQEIEEAWIDLFEWVAIDMYLTNPTKALKDLTKSEFAKRFNSA